MQVRRLTSRECAIVFTAQGLARGDSYCLDDLSAFRLWQDAWVVEDGDGRETFQDALQAALFFVRRAWDRMGVK